MATINQSPAGQASITLSGITFNNIVATATPVRTGQRLTVQGGSFAVSFGGARGPLAISAITMLDAPGDNAVSLATMAAAKITGTRINRMMAVSNLSVGTLAAVQQDGMDVVVVAKTYSMNS
jgi:hypothetical protein